MSKKMVVYEKIKVRNYCTFTNDGWSEWEDTEETFEECCNRIDEMFKNKMCYCCVQVAKFYYDENGNKLGMWDCGNTCYEGHWNHKIKA